ncbi:MAG TPA: EpsI family protein [Thermoanaerobaculia bacterium]
MISPLWRWAPAAVLLAGATMTVGIDTQKEMPLRTSLEDALPRRFANFEGRDVTLAAEEVQVAGVSEYLFREFIPDAEAGDPATSFSVYVGYYDSQTQGRTIHSPKNCLPGAGWEALQSERVTIETTEGPRVANQYLLQRDEQQALVLYWYQGRGRVESNEYLVKAQLLRDAALRGRSEEALVRIVVPITTDIAAARSLAVDVAEQLMTAVDRALPA